MPDPQNTAPEPGFLADLPMQPSGSGVADLEVAFERMKLADEADEAAPAGPGETAVPTIADGAAQESAAHPS